MVIRVIFVRMGMLMLEIGIVVLYVAVWVDTSIENERCASISFC